MIMIMSSNSQINSKQKFNKYMNLTISQQKQKYLFLLFEDLLQQFNYHQIYQIEEIERVMNEVERLIEEDQDVRKSIKIMKKNQDQGYNDGDSQYISMKLNKNNINIKNKQIDTKPKSLKAIDIMNQAKERQKEKQLQKQNHRQQMNIKNKRQLLKNKLKEQIEKKQKLGRNEKSKQNKDNIDKQNHLNNSNINDGVIISKNGKYAKQNIQKSSFSNKSTTQHKQSIQSLLATQKSSEQSKNPHQQNLKTTTQKTKGHQFLLESLSFRQTLLMYYTLVLQNIIRYQTTLLLEDRLYEKYWYLFKKIMGFDQNEFGTVNGYGDQKDKNNFKRFEGKQESKQQKQKGEKQQKEERERYFMRSVMYSSNSNKIDPHQILTYLINYRHVGLKNKNKYNLNKDQFLIKQIDIDKQQNKMKIILIQYLKMIGLNQSINKPNKKHQNSQTMHLNKQLLKLGLKNKQFINSLKQLYIQQIQKQKINKTYYVQNKSQHIFINKSQQQQNKSLWYRIKGLFGGNENNNLNIKQDHNYKNNKKQKQFQIQQQFKIQKISIKQLLQQIFQKFDRYYNEINPQSNEYKS